jgi:hypothetical protein
MHRLFKDEPQPPAQSLWNRRLEACSRELLDPRRAKASVAEIAFSLGVQRRGAFRFRFGASPRERRATNS